MHPGHVSPWNELHDNVAGQLQTCYEAEVQESGVDRSQLTCPLGPEDANLGLIMHCQSKDGEVGPFWDTTNASIQA